MNGRIWLESEVGKGSKFSFTAQFGAAPQAMSSTADAELNLAGCRILVVDDHQINRLIVREMISSRGAEVGEAVSGEEALAAIRRAGDAGRPYKIILLDMRMPGIDGLETARQIRSAGYAVDQIVPMLSSDDLKSQLIRLGELGLNVYVVKPVTHKELFDAIRLGLAGGIPTTSDVMPERSVAEIAVARPANEAPIGILIAEDSPDNRLVVSAYLRREPYQIDFAENGKQAVAMFKSQRYAMVLMDIQMPELDGLSATRLIRQWEIEQPSRQTPIVALTASVLAEDVRNALAAGCNMHLAKPLRKHTLLEVIRHTIMLHADAAPPTGTA
jgi:CheY-like chemotaxis protein